VRSAGACNIIGWSWLSRSTIAASGWVTGIDVIVSIPPLKMIGSARVA
jgi:hypothetical protein